MDEIEIRVFGEISDYKEKIYFLNFRQWLFSILTVIVVVPTYIVLKNRIGKEITSYIVIVIAAILGFLGFIKIHELPAEKLLPYLIRHIFFFNKPIIYIPEYELLEQVKNKRKKNEKSLNSKMIVKKANKRKKLLEKARKKYGDIKKESTQDDTVELIAKLKTLTKEQKEALFKIIK